MSRTTRTNFPGAFRVVLEHSWGTEYKGPYQTLGAAKGQLTMETGQFWPKEHGTTGYIEYIKGEWERVEDGLA